MALSSVAKLKCNRSKLLMFTRHLNNKVLISSVLALKAHSVWHHHLHTVPLTPVRTDLRFHAFSTRFKPCDQRATKVRIRPRFCSAVLELFLVSTWLRKMDLTVFSLCKWTRAWSSVHPSAFRFNESCNLKRISLCDVSNCDVNLILFFFLLLIRFFANQTSTKHVDIEQIYYKSYA